MFDFQPRLQGALLDLRPAAPDDWVGLFALASDPAVWALHPESDRYTEAKFRRHFEDGIASGGALTARCRKTGAIAGWSRFSIKAAEAGGMEIGWTFLGRAYWGGAHNTEMKRLMLGHAFGHVERVIFRVGETNLRSRRAVEKLGATLLPRMDSMTVDDRVVPYVVYGLKRPLSHLPAAAE